jgi:acyl-CoA reductase-like NAD-dependent aldehyde dehydrogenase
MAADLLHLPVLRQGTPYRSRDTYTLTDVRDGAPVATVSRANRGLIALDLSRKAEHRRRLQEVPVAELFAIGKRAAKLFLDGEVVVDPVDGVTQTADDYVRQLSATTGMPRTLARANMHKIAFVLDEMEQVIGGLTRGLDLDVLDRGWIRQDGRFVSYQRQADVLGAVLPSNSPGVHSLWIPSFGLKTPVALKPGRQEPWSPIRIAQALIAAGLPAEAVGLYPSDHDAAGEILLKCDRSMLFGDERTVGSWANDPRIELHGPGWSKVVFGADHASRWEEHVDLLAASVAENGGRSCINASGVWTPAHGREIARGLAERMAAIEARPLDHDEARLAAFPDPRVAHRIREYIDAQLEIPGAVDVTAEFRPGGRVAEAGGCTFLLPTIVHCDDPGHPLASAEFLFPFAAVVEVPQAELLDRMGPTLVVSALTDDDAFVAELFRSPNVERLNIGAFPTCKLSWDQPHEGNLFDLLYRQRAFQTVIPGTVGA